ncbi:hypothetical protein KI809_01255 [Geobacter pelophilus]|jgi:hypothetical protein|uniref:Lipoprotein n=1 Tax=Geoanaerobacter pelophilus TaxID=60036 RepID=A0AAW4KWG5_9BACT|nr:hypothetical protein [Geoanaerobacter pelophilus]MBT0662911.1 hypothetical protein [Geoanaerobacter pelophilus]
MLARFSFLSLTLLLLSGCAFEIDTAMDMDFAPEESTAIKWLEKNAGTTSGDAELLAAQVLKNGGKPQKSGNLSAWLMSEDLPFSVVAVDEQVSTADNGTTKRTLYRFQEDALIAYSYPEYHERVETGEDKNKREQYAREVAMQAKMGTAPSRPAMYEGKYAYSPKYDGFCRVAITEYNTKRQVLATYSIDVCPKGEQ